MSPASTRIDEPRRSVRLFDQHPDAGDVAREVLAGLDSEPKSISPKYFYDRRGSQLFDAITELEEYYPTRTEIAILERHGAEIAECVGRDAFLIEYGSGSSTKIRMLLESLRPSAYMPVDISREHLLAAAEAIAADYDWLDVYATCADYTGEWTLPLDPGAHDRLGFFPGSSIGNFEPAAAQRFLERVRKTVGEGGSLLVGVDLKKAHDVLVRAYDDASGVTAEFNRNVLRHLNARLGADFVPERFTHEAVYDARLGRIEMHLVSDVAQQVRIAGRTIDFAAGERIHTENSYKYDPDDFEALGRAAGFEPVARWLDPARWFGMFLLGA